MKYFIDTEFLEGTQEPKLLILKSRLSHWMIGKPKPTIDLISIGIVAEDGREYYAISKEFNLKEAWNRCDVFTDKLGQKGTIYWIRENVLKPIWEDLNKNKSISNRELSFTYSSLKSFLNKYGKTNKQIAEEVKEFCNVGSVISNKGKNVRYYKEFTESIDTWINVETIQRNNPIHYNNKPEFYGYYSDYDWVVFCWLFGKMIDLPNGFPKYCIDLKQMLDEYALNAKFAVGSIQGGSLKNRLDWIKGEEDYPKQTNEHNALADAKWNKELYEFINTL